MGEVKHLRVYLVLFFSIEEKQLLYVIFGRIITAPFRCLYKGSCCNEGLNYLTILLPLIHNPVYFGVLFLSSTTKQTGEAFSIEEGPKKLTGAK